MRSMYALEYFLFALVITWTILKIQGDGVLKIEKHHHRCSRKTHITILAGRLYPGEIQHLSRHLRQPCYKFFTFVHGVREVIPWSRHLSIDTKLHVAGSNTVDDINIIKEYHQENNIVKSSGHRIRKILLILQYQVFQDDVFDALSGLDDEPNWNVIMTYQRFYCPPNGTIPWNRVIPTPIWTNNLLSETSNVLMELIKNLRYNPFKFFKHVKIHDSRMKCLKNKTVHIVVENLSITLAQNLEIIRHNLRGISDVKIIIYTALTSGYWTNFVEKRGMNRGKFRIEQSNILMKLQDSFQKSNSENVYLMEETNDFDISLMCGTTPIKGRKSLVVYPSSKESRRYYWTPLCGDKAEMFSIKNINYIYREKYFIAEMLRDSCF